MIVQHPRDLDGYLSRLPDWDADADDSAETANTLFAVGLEQGQMLSTDWSDWLARWDKGGRKNPRDEVKATERLTREEWERRAGIRSGAPQQEAPSTSQPPADGG